MSLCMAQPRLLSSLCEIFRAEIDSIGRSQTKVTRSTGLNSVQTKIYVMLPQAIRSILPDLVPNIVDVVKLTAVAGVMASPELLHSASMARSLTYNTSPTVFAALIDLALLWPVVRLISPLERPIAAS